jgi:hypothetical protein
MALKYRILRAGLGELVDCQLFSDEDFIRREVRTTWILPFAMSRSKMRIWEPPETITPANRAMKARLMVRAVGSDLTAVSQTSAVEVDEHS